MLADDPELAVVAAELATPLVMVVAELVQNAVEHGYDESSPTGTISVVARRLVGRLHLDIEDDGRGLPPVTVRSGLANLADRAERRGGTLHCTSSSSGTEIRWTATVPG